MFPSEKNHPVAICLGGGGGHHRANAEEGAAPTWQHLHRSAQDHLFGGCFSIFQEILTSSKFYVNILDPTIPHNHSETEIIC